MKNIENMQIITTEYLKWLKLNKCKQRIINSS